MARHNRSGRDVGDAMGVSFSVVSQWARGVQVPSIERGEQLAAYLHDKSIATLTRKARTGRCAYMPCSRTFDRIMLRREFCSDRCRRLGNRTPDARREPWQEAIDAFCNECEPEGICRTADCQLRAFSPLLFIPMHEVGRLAS